jgi:hypothetical protein
VQKATPGFRTSPQFGQTRGVSRFGAAGEGFTAAGGVSGAETACGSEAGAGAGRGTGAPQTVQNFATGFSGEPHLLQKDGMAMTPFDQCAELPAVK